MTTIAPNASVATATDELIAEFRGRVAPLGVAVERAVGATDGASAVAALAREIAADDAIVSGELAAAAPRLVAALAGAGVRVVPPGAPAETRDAPLGLSLARLAVAETGSVLLAEPTLADRAVGMLTLAQVVVCPTAALVPSLGDAVGALRAVASQPGGGYATFVTGPSRTADIELTLTVGVQGPRRVVVLFVDDLT